MRILIVIFLISSVFGAGAATAESIASKKPDAPQSEAELLPLKLSLINKKMPDDFLLNVYYGTSELNRILKTDSVFSKAKPKNESPLSISREELLSLPQQNAELSGDVIPFLTQESEREPEKLFSDFSKKQSIFIPLGSFLFIKKRF